MRVFEAFAGIGAQKKALTNLKNKGLIPRFDVIGICEWDYNANNAYKRIHDIETIDFSGNADEYFACNDVSSNSKTALTPRSLWKIPREERERIVANFAATNNICNILDLKEELVKNKKFENVDLLTYSFPCQDLSVAGSIHGFNKGINEETRSGLLLEVEKTLDNLVEKGKNLPNVLLLENVANLVSSRHRGSFDIWLNKLKSLGYSTSWGVLDSGKYGTLQKRRRVFAISYKDKDPQINDNLEEKIDTHYMRHIEKFPKEIISDIFDLSNKKYPEEARGALMNDTPSRWKMIREGLEISELTDSIATVTTKQDRFPNNGFIKTNFDSAGTNKMTTRFITPRETFKLMGFTDEDFEKVYEHEKSSHKLYRFAGNSIVVRVLELLMLEVYEIYKKSHDFAEGENDYGEIFDTAKYRKNL